MVDGRGRTRVSIGGTYSQPVYHDGHLYGFCSSFLTCVDVATGRRLWKSRPPGGQGLVLVEEHLVCVALTRGEDELASGKSGTLNEVDAPELGAFVRSLEHADDADARVDAFLDGQETLPLLEGDIVHFVYRVEAEELLSWEA